MHNEVGGSEQGSGGQVLSHAPPRWEYKLIECISYREDWYPAFENGEEIHNWKAGGTISAYSNRLGEEGWEMVNFTHSAAGGHPDYREYFWVAFKRRRPPRDGRESSDVLETRAASNSA